MAENKWVCLPRVISYRGSLNCPFEGNQTMQMYGMFERFLLIIAVFGLEI